MLSLKRLYQCVQRPHDTQNRKHFSTLVAGMLKHLMIGTSEDHDAAEVLEFILTEACKLQEFAFHKTWFMFTQDRTKESEDRCQCSAQEGKHVKSVSERGFVVTYRPEVEAGASLITLRTFAVEAQERTEHVNLSEAMSTGVKKADVRS